MVGEGEVWWGVVDFGTSQGDARFWGCQRHPHQQRFQSGELLLGRQPLRAACAAPGCVKDQLEALGAAASAVRSCQGTPLPAPVLSSSCSLVAALHAHECSVVGKFCAEASLHQQRPSQCTKMTQAQSISTHRRQCSKTLSAGTRGFVFSITSIPCRRRREVRV